MNYEYHITTAAGTTEDAPTKTTLKLGPGILHSAEVEFPPGSWGEHRLRILLAGAQEFPKNLGGYIASDAHVVQMREWIAIKDEPFELEARTWNADTVNAHTLTVRFGVLPEEVLTQASQAKRLTDAILGLFRFQTRL